MVIELIHQFISFFIDCQRLSVNSYYLQKVITLREYFVSSRNYRIEQVFIMILIKIESQVEEILFESIINSVNNINYRRQKSKSEKQQEI